MTTLLDRPAPPPAQGGRPRRARKGRALNAIIPILLVLAGMFVLIYPVVATQYNNVKQREFSMEYNNKVGESDPVDLSADLAKAREYNKTLNGIPILDPYLLKAASPPESKAWNAYKSNLARFEVMARVRVPAADINLPVYHGTGDDVIAKGVGHLYGTSLPVGGPNSHSVLTSHTGMPDATLFDHLTKVKEGDLIYVDVLGETLAYQVHQIKVVLPNGIDDLKQVKGEDLITLFTCTPYAVNTHRLLVTGHRVPYTAPPAPTGAAAVASAIKIEPWMYGLLAGAVVALGLLVFIVVRERRNRRIPARALPAERGKAGKAAKASRKAFAKKAPRRVDDTPRRDPASPASPARAISPRSPRSAPEAQLGDGVGEGLGEGPGREA